jgi:tetratricopeptide (TPR) repeat protein
LLLLFAAAVVPYLRTLNYEYTYDDHSHVVRNAFLHDPSNLRRLVTEYFRLEVPDQTRPVLLLTHFLDRAVGGPGPKIAHLQSVLWHGIATVLVAKLGKAVGLGAGVAFGAGLLFAVHPALAEAVAGISNREDVLATVFSLAALLLSKRALSGRSGAAAAAVLCFATALLSKEVAVVVPLVFLPMVACLPGWRSAVSRRGVWQLAGGAGVVLVGWAALQLYMGTPGLRRDAGASPLRQATAFVGQPILAAGSALVVANAVYTAARVPDGDARQVHATLGIHHAAPVEAFRAVQLGVGYPTSSEYDLSRFRSPWAWLGSGIVLFGMAFGLSRVRRSAPVPFVSVLFAFIATLPVLIPPLLINPLADRFLYLPAVGACWALSYFALEGIPRAAARDVRDVGLPVFIVWLGLFFALSISSVARWQDDVALFSHATKWAPTSARAHQNLGAALLERSRVVEAEQSLLEAVRLDPSLVAAHYNLGTLSERLNRRPTAISHYLAGLAQQSIVGELGLRERMLFRVAPLLLRAQRAVELERVLERERRDYPANAGIGPATEQLAAFRAKSPRPP